MKPIRCTLFSLLVFSSLLIPGAWALDQGHDKADGICLEQNDCYTLLNDGTVVHRVEKKLKILTIYAFHRVFGETFILYNPRFQEVKFHRAVTTMADGKEVPCTPNAFNEILPGSCEPHAPYLHLREMVVTHLGLEAGAVIHLDYEVISKPGFYPFLMGQEVFGSTRHPILKKMVKVTVPESVELKAELLNHEGMEPEKKTAGGRKSFTWTLTDLPQAPPEAGAMDLADYMPYLVFSTAPSWPNAAGLMNQRISAASWLDPKSEKTVEKLKAEAANSMELARKINRFVVEDVANVGLDPELLGYGFLQAKEVYHSRSGYSLDKGILLVKMLRAAGFQAEPVLVSRHRAVAEKVPSWLQFSDLRVICTIQTGLDRPLFLEKFLYLSPMKMVGSTYESDLAGRTLFRPSLNTKENILKKMEPLKRDENMVKADLHLALDEKYGLNGDLAFQVAGALNPYLALQENSEGWAGSAFRTLLPGAEFKEIKPTLMGPVRSAFRASVKTPKTLKEKNGLVEYTIPSGPGGVHSLRVPVASAQRATPLQLSHPVLEEINVEIRIPDGLEVVSLPPPVELTNSAGFILSGAWLEEGVLHIKRFIALKQQIGPKDYPALREIVLEYEAPDARRILLKKGN